MGVWRAGMRCLKDLLKSLPARGSPLVCGSRRVEQVGIYLEGAALFSEAPLPPKEMVSPLDL